MSSDNSNFLEDISELPSKLQVHTLAFVELFERRCDDLAQSLRGVLGRDAPTPTPHLPPARLVPSKGYSQRVADFLWNNRAIVAGLVAFVGTGGVLYYRQRKAYMQKRRAKRGVTGSRREVVVVSGSVKSPITRSVVHDLERRLFIPYVIASSSQEEESIKQESKQHIIPLHLDITDPFDTENSLANFSETLQSTKQELHLAGIIVIPDSHFTSGPIQVLSPEVWSDAFNTRLVHTIATIQAFIPLLAQHRSRLLVLTPTITSSLALPFHGVETSTVSALEGFTASLCAEMARLGADVCNIRLGNFNLEGQDKTALVRNASSEVLSWPTTIKETYGESFMALADSRRPTARGSPLRELHNTIFDALTQERSPGSVVAVGRGSRMYPFVGRWAPDNLVAWMMGLR